MNKTKLTWTNPTKNTDGSPYDQATMGAGYELSLNGEGATISLPFALGTEFDMKDLEAYIALPSGDHTVGLRVVSREGVPSDYSVASFRKIPTPAAVSNLAVV